MGLEGEKQLSGSVSWKGGVRSRGSGQRWPDKGEVRGQRQEQEDSQWELQ